MSLAAAYGIAVLSTPAGISGAVLLLPFQVSVLGTPSPAVTPTNLLYNIVATPGGLYRYWRQGQTGGSLAKVLIAGTLPGVVAGSVIRVELLPGPRVFGLVVSAVLLPLGAWLALTRPPGTGERSALAAFHLRAPPPRRLGRLRRWHLRDRGRLHPGPRPDRVGPRARRGRSRRPRLDFRHFRGRGDHFHRLVRPPRHRQPRTGRPASPWASAGWRARTPVPASSPACPMPSSAAWSASRPSPSAHATCGSA